MFVIFIKFGDKNDDYEEVVQHQMKLFKIRLNKLNGSEMEVPDYQIEAE